ncbi:NAD(P)/FAD-dependent oxidoreductase [Auraticoccus monumenti]|uniref:NADH dehydrogenase n=1 Tax=Auraticoccus monumenti TaxID=675864 RepID=A0A1G7CH57_9ACTN|nr:FAD-dependent oxidoreductase [Auraticoccus monumenti]SDE38678.1 NADH dehydrogenase [Auraticoccus monumenti]
MFRTPHVLVVGGGYAGFYAAWHLEKRLKPSEAYVTILDPRPYMTYQPFLPEVAAGSIEARHVAVSLRRHLRRTTVLAGRATSIDHASRVVHTRMNDGREVDLSYDVVVVTAGAVTRTLPVPGIAEVAFGLKHVEEAVAIRDAFLTALDRAAALPKGPARTKALTVTFVGGGFAGAEGFGELLSLSRAALKRYPEISADEVRFHLVKASERILPEVRATTGARVVRSLERRGARVHLRTTVTSAVGGEVVLSSGERFESGLVVWTAGTAANPVISKHTDLPVNQRGLVVVRPDLRVGTVDHPVLDAWAAGDAAAVPDLTRTASPPYVYTVPNAQHAVRQGRRLARNITRTLRGSEPRPYRHRSLGTVATLGLGTGVFEAGPVVVTGLGGWLIHRGYQVLAIPTWERKIRVAFVWLTAFFLGRDIVSLTSVQQPRHEFVSGGRPERRPQLEQQVRHVA